MGMISTLIKQVIQPTAADLNATEVNSGAIKIAAEKIATAIHLEDDSTSRGILIQGSRVGIAKDLVVNSAGDLLISLDGEIINVGGDVASGTVDSGNPVKLGGRAATSLTTFADGERCDLAVSTQGLLVITSVSAGLFVRGPTDHGLTVTHNPQLIGVESHSFAASPAAVDDGDVVRLAANRDGVLFVLGGHPNTLTGQQQRTTSGTTTIDTPASGHRFIVTELAAFADSGNTAGVRGQFKLGSQVIGRMESVPAGGGFARGDGSGVLSVGAADAALTVESDSSQTIDFHVSYFEIDG